MTIKDLINSKNLTTEFVSLNTGIKKDKLDFYLKD